MSLAAVTSIMKAARSHGGLSVGSGHSERQDGRDGSFHDTMDSMAASKQGCRAKVIRLEALLIRPTPCLSFSDGRADPRVGLYLPTTKPPTNVQYGGCLWYRGYCYLNLC